MAMKSHDTPNNTVITTRESLRGNGSSMIPIVVMTHAHLHDYSLDKTDVPSMNN